MCATTSNIVRATAHGPVPREHHLTRSERVGIPAFHERQPQPGYRQLTYMVLDAGEVAVSPSSVYRVLKAAGGLDRWRRTPSTQGSEPRAHRVAEHALRGSWRRVLPLPNLS